MPQCAALRSFSMLSHLFLGMSLVGAEWVLYLLIALSILSVALIFERAGFYRKASRGLREFRAQVREAGLSGKWEAVAEAARKRSGTPDLESEMTFSVVSRAKSQASTEILGEVAQDAVLRAKLQWERNLAVLATIGNNAPFIGLFGTVLGIIKAFHDLSQQSGGANAATAGISEALITTAVGILVAIPAVVAFNVFQRRVKSAMGEAEALKSFLVGHLAKNSEGSR
jgi:biopolymer transport protein ExbB